MKLNDNTIATQLRNAQKEKSADKVRNDVQFLTMMYGLRPVEIIRKAVQLYRGINIRDPKDDRVITMVMALHLRDHPGAFKKLKEKRPIRKPTRRGARRPGALKR